MNEQRPVKGVGKAAEAIRSGELHPSWRAFIEYCSKLGYGEIERLTIQDGLPVLAEQTKQRVKFTS